MEPYNLLDLNFGQLSHNIIYPYQNKISQLNQSFNNNTYRDMLHQGLRKTRQGIHDYIFPLLFQNSNSLKGFTRFLKLILKLLTILTYRHRILNIIFHPSPLIMLSQVSIHLVCTQVFRLHRAVSLYKDGKNQITHTRHTQSPLNP